MIQAAGILILTPENCALFLLRGNGSDHPMEWCFPGGQREDEDKGIINTAIRETAEECGLELTAADLVEHTRGIAKAEPTSTVEEGEEPPAPSEDVDFTTFRARVKKEFTPVLCEEHIGYCWAPVDFPPQPLHPGTRIACDRTRMTEIDVAKAMSLGELVSPQRYESITLFNLRITGTGEAYRSKIDEHVWRDASLYMNPEFLERCNGLPVIMEHPESSVLNSKEFNKRMVGTIIYPYLLPEVDEVWGIARIMDDAAIKLMISEQVSTSPAVTFDFRSENIEGKTKDGKKILIEGKPSLIDHLAICWEGVWDKGGPPEGVDRKGAELAMADSTASFDFADLQQLNDAMTMLSIRMSNLASPRRRS